MDNLISFLIAATLIGGLLAYYLRQEKKREAKFKEAAERGKIPLGWPTVPTPLHRQ